MTQIRFKWFCRASSSCFDLIIEFMFISSLYTFHIYMSNCIYMHFTCMYMCVCVTPKNYMLGYVVSDKIPNFLIRKQNGEEMKQTCVKSHKICHLTLTFELKYRDYADHGECSRWRIQTVLLHFEA